MGYKRPRTYCISFHSDSSHNPSDSSTYYFGDAGTLSSNTNTGRIHIPKTGIITDFTFHSSHLVLASNEDVTLSIRVNNTTDYALGTYKMDAAAGYLIVNNLNIPITTADYISIKMATPAWVTNPTTVVYGGTVLIQCH